MIKGKKVLAVIPARSGSKGLVGKNIRPMCGKPLIVWSIEKGKLSKYVDTLLVTTDCPKIASIAEKTGAYVPFLRPAKLAQDHTTAYDTLRHAIAFLKERENKVFDYIVLLEPTSPLREDDDVDKMLEHLIENADQFDSIISVGEVDEHPSIIRRINGLRLEPYCPDLELTKRRQDNEPAYFPFGVAYIAKTDVLLSEDTFYTERTTFFKIKRYQNYEIDDLHSFLCAERIMKFEWSL